MGLAITTYPVEAQILALLSINEMKESLRISYAKEDDLIKRCILAAYDWLAGENGWLNRSVLETGWTLTVDSFASRIELPRAAPALAVSSVNYSVDGSMTAVGGTVYRTQLNGKYGYGYIALKTDQAWPTDGDVQDDAVQIVYTAGMGDGTGANVKTKYPALHKAMALLAGDYFRNREDTFTDIRIVEIDRKIVNGVNRVAGRYRFMNNHG